MILTYSK